MFVVGDTSLLRSLTPKKAKQKRKLVITPVNNSCRFELDCAACENTAKSSGNQDYPIAISLVHNKVAGQRSAKCKTNREQLKGNRIDRHGKQSRSQPSKRNEDDGAFDRLIHEGTIQEVIVTVNRR